jgi:hypothetical protein
MLVLLIARIDMASGGMRFGEAVQKLLREDTHADKESKAIS